MELAFYFFFYLRPGDQLTKQDLDAVDILQDLDVEEIEDVDVEMNVKYCSVCGHER